jgi:UDP-N-acetylmuramate--alanine ligase
MVSRIKSGGHRDARFLASPDVLAPYVAAIAQPGDFVVMLGAGSITYWAAALPKELAALSGKKA